MPTERISGYVIAYDFLERNTRHFLSKAIPGNPVFTQNINLAYFTDKENEAQNLFEFYPTSEDGFFDCRILKAQQEVSITLE